MRTITRISNLLVGICFFVLITVTFGGHEVLHNWSEKHDGILKPEELLIIQFDSRPLDNYWLVTSQWNAHYAARYGHHYQFVTGNDQPCTSCDGSTLGQAWCKLKTMLMIDTTAAKSIKAILYLDSDAVITVNHSMSTVISYIKQDLHWDISKMPMAFNQDGPGFACKQTISLGYSKCFNSGIVLWFRHPQSTKLLRDWWSAASVPFGQMQTISRFPMDWKLNWPWEQAVLHDLYETHHETIMALSFPDLPFLPWTSKKNPKSQYPTDTIEPYCFGHWPGADCFITHFCASRKQKEKLRITYSSLIPLYYPTVNGSISQSSSVVTLSMLESEAAQREYSMPLCLDAIETHHM